MLFLPRIDILFAKIDTKLHIVYYIFPTKIEQTYTSETLG